MASQSACSSLLSSNRCLLRQRFGSTFGAISRKDVTFQTNFTQKALATSLKWTQKNRPQIRLNRGVIVCSLNPDSEASIGGGDETGQIEGKPETGSFFWTAGPLLLLMSFAISLLIGNALNLMTMEKLSVEYMTWSCCKKLALSLVAVYLTWPDLGTKGLVAMTPFIASCVAQILLEVSLKLRGPSSWPLVPIILEVYRMDRLEHGARSLLENYAKALDGTLEGKPDCITIRVIVMLLAMRVLDVTCLWSLIKFLFKVFLANPAAENK